MPTFKVFIRESVVNRFYVRIHDASDARVAIERARVQLATDSSCTRREQDEEVTDLAVFAVDEVCGCDEDLVRSWELEDVSGAVGVPFRIES